MPEPSTYLYACLLLKPTLFLLFSPRNKRGVQIVTVRAHSRYRCRTQRLSQSRQRSYRAFTHDVFKPLKKFDRTEHSSQQTVAARRDLSGEDRHRFPLRRRSMSMSLFSSWLLRACLDMKGGAVRFFRLLKASTLRIRMIA